MTVDFLEKYEYLENFIIWYIQELVFNVLNDSENEPEFSAVTANNLIKCHIDVSKKLKKSMPYDDVKGFFTWCNFTQNDFQLFEEKRIRESSYYRSKQY